MFMHVLAGWLKLVRWFSWQCMCVHVCAVCKKSVKMLMFVVKVSSGNVREMSNLPSGL